MNLKTLSCLLLIWSFTFLSCDKEDEPLPSYLHIESAECCGSDYATYGSNSHKINTSWVFVGTDALGVYDMPHSEAIPVLLSGNQKVVIRPGFWNNGISSTPIVSPLHNDFVVPILDLQPLQTDTIQPVFTYHEDVEMFLNSDFEGSNEFSNSLNGQSIDLTNIDAFEGNRSAQVSLNSNDTIGEIILKNPIALPFNNIATIIELDYKNSTPITVFLKALSFESSESLVLFVLNLKEQENWNKVYVDLTSTLVQLQADAYQIGFTMSLPEGQTDAEVYFDNIKIMSRIYTE